MSKIMNTMKVVLRGKFMALSTYIKKLIDLILMT